MQLELGTGSWRPPAKGSSNGNSGGATSCDLLSEEDLREGAPPRKGTLLDTPDHWDRGDGEPGRSSTMDAVAAACTASNSATEGALMRGRIGPPAGLHGGGAPVPSTVTSHPLFDIEVESIFEVGLYDVDDDDSRDSRVNSASAAPDNPTSALDSVAASVRHAADKIPTGGGSQIISGGRPPRHPLPPRPTSSVALPQSPRGLALAHLDLEAAAAVTSAAVTHQADVTPQAHQAAAAPPRSGDNTEPSGGASGGGLLFELD